MRDKQLEKFVQDRLQNNVDMQFEEYLIEKQQSIKAPKNKKSITTSLRAWSIAITCIIILVSSIVLLSISILHNDTDIAHYAQADIIIDNIEIDRVKELLGLQISEENLTESVVASDSKSGDILYYTIKWDDEEKFVNYKVDIVTNKNYYPIRKKTNSERTIGNYSIKILSNIDLEEEEGIYIHNIYGEVFIADFLVLINYEEWNMNETEDLFNEFIGKALNIDKQ